MARAPEERGPGGSDWPTAGCQIPASRMVGVRFNPTAGLPEAVLGNQRRWRGDTQPWPRLAMIAGGVPPGTGKN